MAVQLLRPFSRSYGYAGAEPVLRGPRYVRTRAMGRWHLVRAGIHHPASVHLPERTSWQLWCGPFCSSTKSIGRDRKPTDFPICGTCQGRSDGYRRTGDLIHLPHGQRPPRTCPGSLADGLYVEISERVGRCLVCGNVEPLRGSGGRGYSAWSRYGCQRHEPGPGLIDGCPIHAWHHLTGHDGLVGCYACQRVVTAKEPI